MAWHVVYRNSTGAAVSEGPTKPLKVPSGFTLEKLMLRVRIRRVRSGIQAKLSS